MSAQRRLAALVALTWALGAGAQAPASWEAAFLASPSELFKATGQRVLVAGGSREAETALAAEGLLAALRRRAEATLVMDDTGLGDVTGQSDEAVARRASALPWERLYLVRVYPGVTGAPPSAVVLVSSRSGPLGSAVVSKADAPAPAGPVEAAAPAPRPAAVAPPAPAPSAAEQAYTARRLHFGSLRSKDPAMLLNNGVFVGNQRLERHALYETLKSAEFLARWDGRARLKLGIGVASAAVMALGGVGFVATATSRCVEVQGTSSGPCLRRELPPGLLVASAVTAGVGLVGVLLAVFLPADPMDPAEVMGAIERYNQALRRDLGVTLRVTPAVTPGGTGLAVSGTF